MPYGVVTRPDAGADRSYRFVILYKFRTYFRVENLSTSKARANITAVMDRLVANRAPIGISRMSI